MPRTNPIGDASAMPSPFAVSINMRQYSAKGRRVAARRRNGFPPALKAPLALKRNAQGERRKKGAGTTDRMGVLQVPLGSMCELLTKKHILGIQ